MERSTNLKSPSLREQQVIFFAVIFFWMKFNHRQCLEPNYQPPDLPEGTESASSLELLQFIFQAQRDANADSDGDAVKVTMRVLASHPQRWKLFSELQDELLERIAHALEKMFENQEFCAQCESWSYYDALTAEDFAISAATDMLWLTNIIPWLGELETADERFAAVEHVLATWLPSWKKIETQPT